MDFAPGGVNGTALGGRNAFFYSMHMDSGSCLRVILCLIMLGLSGCGVKSPRVTLSEVTLGEVTDEGFIINFNLTLANPNPETLELYRVKYDVAVDGRPAYHGLRSAEASVSARGEVTIRVPAVVLYDDIGGDHVPTSLDYALSGRLWYLSPGELAEVLFDAGVQRPSVAFVAAGTLTFNAGGQSPPPKPGGGS